MKVTIVSASTRDYAQSLRVAQYIKTYLEQKKITTDVVDLNRQRLPLYDDSVEGPWQEVWKPISEQLNTADGFVFVAPEWHGTMGPGLLNMLMYAKHEMAHKPVMLVGVSSGRGGTYPLVDMRTVGYKNRHYVIVPESAIIGHVKETLVDGRFTDEKCAERLHYGLDVLLEYATALLLVRASGTLDLDKFKNGV